MPVVLVLNTGEMAGVLEQHLDGGAQDLLTIKIACHEGRNSYFAGACRTGVDFGIV